MILFEIDGKFYQNGQRISYQRYMELKDLEERTANHQVTLDRPSTPFDHIAFANKFRPRNSNH